MGAGDPLGPALMVVLGCVAQVRGLGWDANLGGKDFDDIVLNMMADEFNSKVPALL